MYMFLLDHFFFLLKIELSEHKKKEIKNPVNSIIMLLYLDSL